MKKTIFALLVAAGASTAFAGPFQLGSLVVVRSGVEGGGTLNSSATATFLDEYSMSGVLLQSIPMPTTVSGSQRRLVIGGSATSEGSLTRSADGQYLALAGYDADVGTASVATTTSAAAARVIGRVGFNGTVDTSTTTTAFSGQSIRGAVSVDGNQFWATGGTNGVQYFDSLGASSSIQLNTLAGSSTNNRNVSIQGGQLYISSASGANRGVIAIGTGLPTTAGATSTLLPGTSSITGTSPYDFYFANSNLLYIIDDSAQQGGLQKWELQSGTWVRTTVFALATGNQSRQFTASTDGMGVTTFFLTARDSAGISTIQRLTDTGPASTFSIIATVPVNTVLRGIEFAPIPTPGSLALLGLGGLVATRRRR